MNAIWRTLRGRVRCNKRYTTWRERAGWELVLQKPARITGAVAIIIASGRPDRCRRDADNLPKAIVDLLTAHQVIEDDAKVASITSRWDSTLPAGIVLVTVDLAMAAAEM